MNGHPLIISIALGLLFISLIIGVIFGSNSKAKGRKITGQFLPVLITAGFVASVFFLSGGFTMKTIEWVQFGFIFLAPAGVMMLVSMFSLGILGMIQSKRQDSKGLLVFSLVNVLALPVVGITAWQMFG